MATKNNHGDDEVMIFVDEDGNEIVVDELVDGPETIEEGLGKEVELEEEYELEEPAFEPEALDDEEYEDDDESGVGISGLTSKLTIILGALIAVIAIGIGIFMITRKAGGNKDTDFSTVGANFQEIALIGGGNVETIASTQGARLDAILDVVKNYDYDEADEEGGITTVSVTLTSILKDLKIKFVNSKGKLIANLPFEVEVTAPDGTVTTWTDTDKDGIIYQTDLSGGSYSVKLKALSGFDGYFDFSQAGTQSLAVKTQLDYQKVDVKNEIKKSSQVDEKEDTKEKDTALESKLTDTVTWVISSKTAKSDGYTAVSKDTIKNPLTVVTEKNEAGIARFFRLADGGSHVFGTWEEVDATYHARTCTDPDCDPSVDPTAKETEQHVFADGKCTVCQATDPNYQPPAHSHIAGSDWLYDTTYHAHKCSDPTCTETTMANLPGYGQHAYSGYTKQGDKTTKQHEQTCECGYVLTTPCTDANSDGICDACSGVVADPVAKKITVALPAAPVLSTTGTKTGTIEASATFDPANPSNVTYTWSIEGTDNGVIDLSDKDKAKVTLTAKKAGTQKIKCTVKADGYTEGSSVVEVTVKGNITITLDKTGKKALFVGGDTFTLNAVTKGGEKNTIKWSSSDDSVVELKDGTETANATEGKHSVLITPKKAGTVTVTATSTENGEVKASLTVVVSVHPKDDNVTKLVNTSGQQIYVKGSDGKYKEATYANYYTGETLYVLSGTAQYTYQGWWTIDGKTYFFDSNGNKVTGDQVILGAKYSFDSNGVLKSGTGSFGIDVSKWNGSIDWAKVAKSGVNYAIIRCGFRGNTVGGLVLDDKFESNIKNATSNGIKVGIYFFTQAISEAEAIEEASMCLSLVEGYKVSYPIFIDVESSGGRADKLTKDQRTNIIKAFCKTVTNNGYKAGVYANKTWLTNQINTGDLTNYTIWLAQYASSTTYTSTRYDLWQYSDQGSIGGISGKVDLDLSYLGY